MVILRDQSILWSLQCPFVTRRITYSKWRIMAEEELVVHKSPAIHVIPEFLIV